jgi:hypothetical protein
LSLSLMSPHQNPPVPHTYHMPRPSRSGFEQPNNILWGVQILVVITRGILWVTEFKEAFVENLACTPKIVHSPAWEPRRVHIGLYPDSHKLIPHPWTMFLWYTSRTIVIFPSRPRSANFFFSDLDTKILQAFFAFPLNRTSPLAHRKWCTVNVFWLLITVLIKKILPVTRISNLIILNNEVRLTLHLAVVMNDTILWQIRHEDVLYSLYWLFVNHPYLRNKDSVALVWFSVSCSQARPKYVLRVQPGKKVREAEIPVFG